MSDAAVRLRWRACALLLAALSVWPSRGVSAEPTAPEAKAEVYQTWPFDAAEAKRRQEETAKRLGIPVERTLDLGNGVKLELVLIPAGRFIMGTPEPEPVDEEGFRNKILTGQVVLGIGGGAFLILLGVVLVRAIRKRQRPQYSLAWFLAMTVAAGIGLLGGLHWHYSVRALAEVQTAYEAALGRFMSKYGYEKPAHDVTLTKPYYVGKYEITQEQYQQIMGNNPSRSKGRDLPVEEVSWKDAQEFCRKASEKTGLAVRLPTNAEWERACRAGTKTTYYTGDAETDLDRAGWYDKNSGGKTRPVGEKAPNAWGVHDMHGNVWEWGADWFETYKADAVVDPQGPTQGACRVLRGGSWYFDPSPCRSAFRFRDYPVAHDNLIGFRVVVEVPRVR
jgi:formylglycine-generating enzyme required for sulfatase activity